MKIKILALISITLLLFNFSTVLAVENALNLGIKNCEDSDGYNIYEKGTAAGVPNPLYDWTGGANYIEVYDLCVRGDVYEHYCDQEGYVRRFTVACNHGCGDGACIRQECWPIGLINESKYCSADDSWKEQKQEAQQCEQNYECESNECFQSECAGGKILKKLINLFRALRMRFLR